MIKSDQNGIESNTLFWHFVNKPRIKSDQNGIESRQACKKVLYLCAVIKSDQNGIER